MIASSRRSADSILVSRKSSVAKLRKLFKGSSQPSRRSMYLQSQWFAGAPKEIEKELFTPHMKTVCSTVM
jgi:hypothetical protein